MKGSRRLPVLPLALFFVLSACVSSQVGATSTLVADQPTTAVSAPSVADLSGPTAVIVDYSPTVSDVGGLMYLLAHPDVDVLAVSLPAAGEAGCDLGVDVTLGILAMFSQEDVPVACDPALPGHARSWPPEFLTGQEDLAFGLPNHETEVSDEGAADLVARVVSDSDRPVVIYAVAPLTNVARALTDHPEMGDGVERLVIMGGAVDVPGNVEGTSAEWNVWIDVSAAAAVLNSGVPITLVPLDATNDVPVPSWYQTAIAKAERTDAIVYLDRLVLLFPSVTSGFFYLWDELAATVVAGETLVDFDEASLVVVPDGPSEGLTAASPEGSLVTVAIGVPDPGAFYANYLGTLAGSPVEVGSTASPEEEAYLVAVQDSFADLERAFGELFSNPAFADDTDYDGAAVAEGVDRLQTGLATSLEIVMQLDPPPTLGEVHENYLTVMEAIVEQRDATVGSFAAASSWEEFDALNTAFNFDEACLPIAEQAALLGLAIRLPCN